MGLLLLAGRLLLGPLDTQEVVPAAAAPRLQGRRAAITRQEHLAGDRRDRVALAAGLEQVLLRMVERVEGRRIVEQLEYAHRPAETGLDHLVDLGGPGNAELDQADRLGQVAVDEPRHEEAGRVLD